MKFIISKRLQMQKVQADPMRVIHSSMADPLPVSQVSETCLAAQRTAAGPCAAGRRRTCISHECLMEELVQHELGIITSW